MENGTRQQMIEARREAAAATTAAREAVADSAREVGRALAELGELVVKLEARGAALAQLEQAGAARPGRGGGALKPHLAALRQAALHADGSDVGDEELQAAALRFAAVAAARTGLALLTPAERARLLAEPLEGTDTGITLALLATLLTGARS